MVGRTLLDTGRYGKVFYLTLDGEGKRQPVLHLGMTGMLQIRGEEAVYYRKKPKQDPSIWPPKFMKVSQCNLYSMRKGFATHPNDPFSLYYTSRQKMPAQIRHILKLPFLTPGGWVAFDFARTHYTNLPSLRWVSTLFSVCRV